MLRAPDFWSRPPGFAARVLAPIGSIYGAVTSRRMAGAGARLEAPAICVGNLTVGGAGKTPTVIALAQMLQAMGKTPFVVSRGYGGSSAGPLRVDPARHDAALVGDEPLEISRRAPVVVARDRLAGARMAISAGADVVLLDDGLQNPSIRKDLVFAVIDGETWFGNGYCLPAGPLRAPIDQQAPHVHAAIVIGGEMRQEEARAFSGKPIFRAQIEPDEKAVASLVGRRVLAFAGIGRPEKFFDMLRARGIDVVAVEGFADHQPFSDEVLARLNDHAMKGGLALATTGKDLARIGDARARAAFGDRLTTVPINLTFTDRQAVQALASKALQT